MLEAVLQESMSDFVAEQGRRRPMRIHLDYGTAEQGLGNDAPTLIAALDLVYVALVDAGFSEVGLRDAALGVGGEPVISWGYVDLAARWGLERELLESFGEDDYWFEHGRNASEATLRVPLVAKLPAASPWRFATNAASGEAALSDLAPTLLEWLGLPALAGARGAEARLDGGASVARDWCDGAVPARPIYAEKVERTGLAGAVQHKVARLHPWRLERRLARDEAGRLRLEVAELEVGELVPPFHHAAQINVRQVAELGLSDARVTDNRNVEIAHFVCWGDALPVLGCSNPFLHGYDAS
jgi:hypothetical protein